MNARARQLGTTLIELIITITVVAIAVTAVLGNLSMTSTMSALALVRHQSTAIAEAYLEEILLRPFVDPDGADGETARAQLDDVDDYNGRTDVGARDQFGNAIAGLDAYTVNVRVQQSTALTGVPGAQALRVDVTATHGSDTPVIATGYRTRY